jgi:uncharacterized protein YoaH (UPF0181 family)
MTTEIVHLGTLACPLVQVGQDGAGRCTAQVVGIPELQATAGTRAEAIEQVRSLLAQRLSSGQLVALAVASPMPQKAPGWAKDDPLEQEFLEELARRRQEDFERTLREYEEEDRACSDTSSTPTTCAAD